MGTVPRRATVGQLFRWVLVLLLAVDLSQFPLPCADDLSEDLGGPELCFATASSADGTLPPVTNGGYRGPCPCACHMGIAPGPAIPVLPAPLVAEISVTAVAVPPAADSKPITHPPIV